jgi:hypothetical protein
MDELTRLLAAYRDAVPTPDPSAEFMPGLWRKIERYRSPERVLRRFAQIFALVAAATAVVVGAVLIPRLQTAPVYSASYIDVLENETGELAYADVAQEHQLHPDRAPEAPPAK